MKSTRKTKVSYIPKVIDWAGARGFEEIRAALPDNDEYEKPISYDRQTDDQSFVPDVTGKLMHEKSYFEVVMKTDKIDRLISKLKLMSVLAARREGNLYVMAPRGHYQFAKEIVYENQITAELVRLT
ncbi:MAG: hypothetical protein R2822_31205 [Spirosomataceae bacterium]